MKSNVRTTLLLVVLFVLAVTSLFAAPPELTTTEISAVPASGTLGIGSTITITVVDVNNGTDPDTQFDAVSLDLTQFGGPDSLAMNKVSNAPGQGRWRASYTVILGSIDGVPNREFSVTAYNDDGFTTVVGSQTYTVDNVPSMNNTDFTGTLYLRINNSNSISEMAVGDSVFVIAGFRPYIETVWVDWGATFTGAPELPYNVNNGSVSIYYKPPAGSLPVNYESDLEITISRLKSIETDDGGPYYSSPAWNRVVSKNQAGFEIAADLNPPSMVGAYDLYYESNTPLRFSPSITALDGYSTGPNTFDIYLRLPGWNTLGGPTEFTLRFVTENRLEFLKTYSSLDSPATVIHDPVTDELIVTWDGTVNDQPIFPNFATTVGITLMEVKDYVGNSSDLTQIPPDHPLVGHPEFPANGDMNDIANHQAIYNGGDHHVGNTISNRIHVVLDGELPVFHQQPFFADLDVSSLSIVRLINDENNNGIWDAGEDVFYNYSDGTPADNLLDFNFQTTRFYTMDSNSLRHESQNYWVVVERVGGTAAQRWFWNGGGWSPLAAFDHLTDAIPLTFYPHPTDGSGSSNSYVETITWDIGDVSSTIFSSATTGSAYKAVVYVQDTAGNIIKAAQTNELQINLSEVYMNIPIVEAVDVVSTHQTVPGGLPQKTLALKTSTLVQSMKIMIRCIAGLLILQMCITTHQMF